MFRRKGGLNWEIKSQPASKFSVLENEISALKKKRAIYKNEPDDLTRLNERIGTLEEELEAAKKA